ncbi:MAG: hypothetical protein IPG77_08230 [Betaproteobacteria bacterium]|nr:hypothetical protein [Betaproteobacteria bacterium]
MNCFSRGTVFAGRRDLATGRDDGDLVHARAHQPRELHAEHDIPSAGLGKRDSSGRCARARSADWPLLRGSMPRNHGAAQLVTAGSTSAWCQHEGCGADHARKSRRAASAVRAPVPCSGAAAGVEDLDVRDDAEHAVAHLLLEAVHHASAR